MAECVLVDWGVSSFRAWRVDAGSGEVLDSHCSDQGITKIDAPPAEFLRKVLGGLVRRQTTDTPVIMAGMAGSSLGLMDVPFALCPVNAPGLFAQSRTLALPGFQAWIIPRVRDSRGGHDDIVRGEETQIFGYLASNGSAGAVTFCLPGTHSKWVDSAGGNITGITTALTGELFACLHNSILVIGAQQDNPEAFFAGLEHARRNPDLILSLFSTRTGVLFGALKTEHGASYLSGLLIGAEIAGILATRTIERRVVVIGADVLCQRYREALHCFGIDAEIHSGERMVRAGLLSALSLLRQ